MKVRYTPLLTAALLFGAASAPLHAQGDAAPPAPPGGGVLDRPIPPTPTDALLRYKFTAGQVLRFNNVSDVNMTITIPGQPKPIPLSQHIEGIMRQTVQSVDPVNNTATLTVKIESIAMTMNGQPMSQSDMQKAQAAADTTLVLSELGKVISAKLNSPSSTYGFDPKQMGMYQQNGVFPIRAVKPGDTWTSTIAMSGVGANITSNFQLTQLTPSVGGAIALIKQTGGGVINSKTATAMPSGVKLNGKITMSGEVQFDVAAGQVKSQSVAAQFDATVNTPAAPQPVGKTVALKKKAPAANPKAPTATMSSKIHMDMTSTMTRLEGDAPATPGAM
ncbi:MAG: hypothetical protein JWQ02_1460 [Capsulimonas sp.]|nr:hypothetical protein [Capsulimonas sp.]